MLSSQGADGSGEVKEAVGRLLAWMEGTRWDELRNEVLVEHFAEFCDCGVEDFDPETMLTDLNREAAMAVYVFAMEDFLSSRFDPGEDNVIDAFLASKGERIGARGREHLVALRDSTPGFYEVVDLVPGQSVTVKNLLRGGPEILVQERSGSSQTLKWDVVAARVLQEGEQTRFSGGLYVYDRGQ